MEVQRLNNYTEIFLSNQRFIFDPPSLKETPPLILSDISLKLNKDKIFNAPGEYNVGNVYFWGFDDKTSISYLFQDQEGTLFYLNGRLSEETFKKLKLMKVEIDALFTGPNFVEKIIPELKPKIIITHKDLNLPKFEKQKGDKFKINLRKVSNLIYVLK